MPTLEWSAQLEQALPAMDDTHREFVALLAQLEAASDEDLVGLWPTLMEHCQAHFDMEDRWMLDTGFAADNCHSSQHKVVLDVLTQGVEHVLVGDGERVRSLLRDLASWFSYHAQTMDAALAQHLRAVGYDPQEGGALHPEALPPVSVTDCGGACSNGRDQVIYAQVQQQMKEAAKSATPSV